MTVSLKITLAAVLAVLGASLPVASRAGSATPADQPGATTVALPEDYIIGSWELYRSKFVTDEGRVTDDDNGMISHSEGQGYGMLIAVSANDRKSFERIWHWTESELFVRDDSLAAWRWDPNSDPHVTDTNDATDGDILIAWALLRASERWGVRDYRREAKAIVDDIADLAIADSRYGRVLLPAADGFDGSSQPDSPVVNLSYWVLPAISELEAISPKLADAKLTESGIKLIEASTFGAQRLPTDWIGLAGEAAKPAENFPAQYGYNAVRIPLYLAWFSQKHSDLLTPFWDAWHVGDVAVPRVVDVETSATVNEMVGPGYLALDDLLSCSLQRSEAAFAAKSFEPTTYYPSTLHILSLIALSEKYPQCL